jgi:5-formyltetrahydrofolate cyclo-ligase
MTKAEIRESIKELRDNISADDRKAYDELILQHFLKTDAYRHCLRLFCYISFGSELNTEEIIRQALQVKKQVYVPRVEEKHRMEFYRIEGLMSLKPSNFGVPEPLPEEERRYRGNTAEEDSSDNLMLLPGLAFDYQGNRVGYGAGYYDRYLNQYSEKHFYKIAACYDFQLMKHITATEYDVRADVIITPTKRILCS